MQGLEVSARFALPPNSKGYCGTSPFAETFVAYLKDKSPANRKSLERSLSQFIAHFAYLKLIARANNLAPFDKKVAEALWIGNGLLEKVRGEDIAKLIKREFCGPGRLSAAKARRLAAALPDGFVPHHSFHVLYIHTISGVIGPNLRNADMCRVSWGKITRVGRGEVEAESQELVKKEGKLVLFPCRKKLKTACAGIVLLPNPKIGELVASHWGVAVMKISRAQAANLEKYTMQNISAANRA